jgi:hypothetical protein
VNLGLDLSAITGRVHDRNDGDLQRHLAGLVVAGAVHAVGSGPAHVRLERGSGLAAVKLLEVSRLNCNIDKAISPYMKQENPGPIYREPPPPESNRPTGG